MQPADTPATFTNGRRKFDYAGWVERIADEQMSVADLQKALKKELRKRKKRSRLFEERGDGFHIYSATFEPKKTSSAEKKKMITALKKALAVLEGS